MNVQINGSTVTIEKEEFIELLQYKLDVLKDSYEKDPSWNYDIEELETLIFDLKSL